jgi:membrane associated rhomboid family serine protease
MFPLRDNVPSRRFPVVNCFIIAANILAFLFEVRLDDVGVLQPFLATYGLVPARFFESPTLHFPDIFTSMFLHGSWGHVISNMWFLVIFGDNVEDRVGHLRYLFFYLLMGIGAAGAQLAASPASQLPMIGASGAIAGILGAYLVLYPAARVLTLIVIVFFVRFVEIPAFFFLGLWFLTQTVAGIGSLSAQALRGDMGGVAWWAHAGGFAAGFLGIFIFRLRRG